MRRRSAAVVLGLLVTLGWPAVPARAAWASTGSGSETAKSTTIAAPGTLTSSCGVLAVNLSWGASASTFADGYEVRWGTANNGLYPNSSITTGLTKTVNLALGTYYFVVQTKVGQWRSANSNQVSRLVVAVCL
ncbi:MAG: hypothetical protein ACRDZW_07080 [Acidimicrobiales bacterium]